MANTALRFELRLSRPSAQPVSVRIKSADGSALASEDYGTLDVVATLPANTRHAFVEVRLTDDTRTEPDEDFQLALSEPVNVVLGASRSARGVIVDDDLAAGCNPLPASGLCAGAAEGSLRIPIGVPLGGYLRPPVGGEYIPALEQAGEGDFAPFFTSLLGFIPGVSEGGGNNATPPNEARRSQYSTFSPSTRGYYDTLTTKAVALTQGGQTLVFVKLDTVGMLDELTEAVRAGVLTRTGINLGNGLVMNATHTHDGPGAIGNRSVKYFWAALDVYNADLFNQAAASIVNVVVSALEKRVPARVGFGFTEETSGANSFRRTRSIYNAARVTDQEALRKRLGLFRIDQVDGAGAFVRPLALMVNFAAHGIVFDVENLYFSGDCLAGLERSVEARFESPVVVMQVQSAGGDISPRADGDPNRQRVERFGERIAPQVLDLWNGISNFERSPTLKVVRQRFVLNRARLGYAMGEYPYEFGAVQCNAQPNTEACLASPPNGADDVADNGVAENDSFVPQDSLLAAIQLGNALIITQPGEPLTEQGVRLLEASPLPRERTFIWGYALDHVGYIQPDFKTDWLGGGTEGTTTFWGWKQGGLIAARAKGVMEALVNGTAPPADEFAIAYRPLPATPPVVTVSPMPGQILEQPADIKRFAQARFLFQGGDPVIDLPTVTIEEDINGRWQPMRRNNGRPLSSYYEHWVDYALTNGGHGYTIRFEPAKDFPIGRYRLVAKGVAMMGPGQGAYTAASNAFTVQEADNLRLETLARSGNTVSATLSYAPVPDNYRLIDAQGSSDLPPPVRLGTVRFVGTDGMRVNASAPVFSVVAGRTLATYSATLPGSDLPTASADDAWGNRTP